MPPSIEQIVAIDEELLTSVRLIHAGFGQLQALEGANNFYHLPLLTLASGFERLMKVVICLRRLESHGEFPGRNVFPRGRRGHSLEALLTQVRKECFLSDYVADIPVAQSDLEYLVSDELLKFVGVLSQFGQAARYHYLNVVLGEGSLHGSPEDTWQELESQIVTSHKGWLDEIVAYPAANDIGKRVIQDVIVRLERFARALSRLFTIGRIGDEARRYLCHIRTFVHLDDSSLGTTRYCPVGTTA